MSTLLKMLHADPGSWQIPADSVAEFANSFIYSRAQIAHAIGKPFILEETGMDVRLLPLSVVHCCCGSVESSSP